MAFLEYDLLSCLANQIPDQSIWPITRDPVISKFFRSSGSIFNFNHATPTPIYSALVCQMLRWQTHLRGAPSSHCRGVNLFKLVPPARGYGPPCCYKPLRSSPVVEPAGMTSSIPCRELEFGPSRHCGASCTMAMWPTESLPRWLNEGREEERRFWGGGGGGGRQRVKGG